MTEPHPTLYLGHDPSYSIDPETDAGTDVLLTIWYDGTAQVAFRPGKERRDLIWSQPTPLAKDTTLVGTHDGVSLFWGRP